MIPLALAARLPWRYIGLALAVAGLIAGGLWAWNNRYDSGYNAGRAGLQAEWDAAERTRLAAELTRRNEAETRAATERADRERTMQAFAERNRTYANTPAGAAICVPAAVVRDLHANRAALFPPAPSGSDAALPPVPAP